MTTPAIHTDVTDWQPVVTKVQYYEAGSATLVFEFEYSWDQPHSRTWRHRPESVSNPIREDGTRARSGYAMDALDIRSPSREMKVKVPDGPYDVVYTHRNVVASLLAGAPGDLMMKIGLGWAAKYSSFPYGIEARAITQALTKLRQQRYDFGATLGELKETIQFTREMCENLVDFLGTVSNKIPANQADIIDFIMGLDVGELKSARNRRFGPRVRSHANKLWGRKAEKLMNLTISVWMTYQFAVKPLLSDIENGRAAIGEALFGETPQPLRMDVRTGCREVSQPSHTYDLGFTPGGTMRVGAVVYTECKISASYDVTPTKDSRAQQWGLTNSYSVLWELTTLSWMVDYLSNMGDWLGTLTPVEGADFVEGTITRYQEGQPGAAEALSPFPGTEAISGFNTREWQMDIVRMERDLLPPVGLLPAFRPAFRNKLGLTQLANSLGALVGIVRNI